MERCEKLAFTPRQSAENELQQKTQETRRKLAFP